MSDELGDGFAKDPKRKKKKRRSAVRVGESLELLSELFGVRLLTRKELRDPILYEQRAWEWGRMKEEQGIEIEMVYDPTHPHAGVTGYLPPKATQIKPGGTLPGRNTACDPRGALNRILASKPDKDGIGQISTQIAIEIVNAALNGDLKKVRALAEIVNQVQGKPQEHVEHTVGTSVVANFVDPSKPEIP